MTPQNNPPPRRPQRPPQRPQQRPAQRSRAVTRPARRFGGTQITWIATAVILVVVLAVVLVTELGSSNAKGPANTGKPVPASVLAELTGVPLSEFNAVGVSSGSVQVVDDGSWFQKKHQKPLVDTATGKPVVLYVGAEYCPYCAASRWGFIVALSRFGTFSNLHYMSSSSTDVDPNTPTFTFYNASYTSKYFTFEHFETETRTGGGLQSLNALAKKAAGTYDDGQVTYVQAGSIPFLDINNRYFLLGSAYDPSILAGATQAEIASGLDDPGITVTRAIITEANFITAEMCDAIKGLPALVCSSSGVKAANKILPLLPSIP